MSIMFNEICIYIYRERERKIEKQSHPKWRIYCERKLTLQHLHSTKTLLGCRKDDIKCRQSVSSFQGSDDDDML